MLVADGFDAVHFARFAVQMHEHNRPGARGYFFFNPLNVNVIRINIWLNEYWNVSAIDDGVDGGDVRI